MSKAIENLQTAQKHAMIIRPKVGGFPYLAETLRRAGVTRNTWSLPACQSIFLTNDGPVVMRGRGERVEPLPPAAAGRLRGKRVLVFKPGFGVATAWAYSRLATNAKAAVGPSVGGVVG